MDKHGKAVTKGLLIQSGHIAIFFIFKTESIGERTKVLHKILVMTFVHLCAL